MSNLLRRIKKLEPKGTDESGFPPHSTQWLAYWTRWFQRTMNNEDPPGRAPFEAVLAIMRAKE